MKLIKKTIFIFVTLAARYALAGDFSVEIDPSAYAFSGYAGHVRYHLGAGWELSAGTYAMKMPSALKPMFLKSNTEDTDIKIKSAYAFFIDKYLSEKSEGYFIGLEIGRQSYQVENLNLSQQAESYDANLFMPRFGYKYILGSSGLYVLPWVGVGYLQLSQDSINLGAHKTELKNILPFATIHLGYNF